ncbi:MAG: hypothetical protein RIR26_2798 [Pseudomonadota bacterium]|jgi:hypothetical protein
MPILFAPPVQVVPFDAERGVEHRKAMEDFRAQVLSLWQTTSKEEIKQGGFRGARILEWNRDFDAVVKTYFVFSSASQGRRGEVARIASLFRKDNCQLLGSVTVWGSEWTNSLPPETDKTELTLLKNAPARSFTPRKSPVRLSTEGQGYWGSAMAWIGESQLGEKLASEGIVVHSDLSGLGCFREVTKPASEQPASQPDKAETATSSAPDPAASKRAHRQLKIVLSGQQGKPPSVWPLTQGHFSILSLPFNELAGKQKQETIALAPFAPTALARTIAPKLLPLLHSLEEKNIVVSQREGRFVTVERGLAFGLRIGMHLVGPDGARLHVIRFATQSGLEDAAILLIRTESKTTPLAAGAQLQLDPAVYPVP